MDGEKETVIAEEQKPEKSTAFKNICDWVETFTFALAAIVLLFLFGIRYVTVDGTSMTNTLQHQDRLIIANAYGNYETGDIVVLRTHSHDYPLIKRVIATGGQTVEIDFENWIVKVDGVVLDEPYVRRESLAPMLYGQYYKGPFTVEEGKLFVMGDNRNGSNDSRNPAIGQIDERLTLGKMLFRFFPISSFGTVD